jgi:hypothetical protein
MSGNPRIKRECCKKNDKIKNLKTGLGTAIAVEGYWQRTLAHSKSNISVKTVEPESRIRPPSPLSSRVKYKITKRGFNRGPRSRDRQALSQRWKGISFDILLPSASHRPFTLPFIETHPQAYRPLRLQVYRHSHPSSHASAPKYFKGMAKQPSRARAPTLIRIIQTIGHPVPP